MAMAPTRHAGLALLVGVVLSMIGSLIFPGGPLVDPVDQTDFAGAIEALAANPGLGHLTTLMVIVGMLLHGYALLALFGLARGGEGFQGPGLRFGIIVSLFGWGLFILSLAKRHMVIHLTQRADIADTATLQEFFDAAALTGHTEMSGLILGFIVIYPFGSALTGLGLVPRFDAMDVFKAACYGLVLVGVVGFLNFVFALFVPDADLLLHLMINNLVLMFGSVCLFVIGLGMYRGRSEFVPADTT
ncbi:MAG: hypothetical protein F4X76_02095 [Chloroflexi bacterium]|nr:hypothetical protein [Chloroflexota bacterium]